MTSGTFGFALFVILTWGFAGVLILRDVRARRADKAWRDKASRVYQRLEARKAVKP